MDLTPDEMDTLEKTMLSSISRVGTEMCSGAAGAVPKIIHSEDPCKYCAMKEVCRTAGGDDGE